MGQISAFRFMDSAGFNRTTPGLQTYSAGVRLDDGRPAADGVYRVVCSEYSGGDDVRLFEQNRVFLIGLISPNWRWCLCYRR